MLFHLPLIGQLVRREIEGRYRGSALGILWSLLTPLLMLGVYTFVFGTVFGARWSVPGQAAADHSTGQFAVILFAGLLVFQLFADVVTRAPTLVLGNVSYVKKIVFPLHVLPIISLGSALFQTLVSLAVLLAFELWFMGRVPVTALLLPFVWTPFLMLILGLSWFLASIGAYVRDIGQFLGTLVTALLFLSPIFFPASALPDWIRPYLWLNPIALPVEQTREVLLWGRQPDWVALAIYATVALAIAFLGRAWFQKTRKGFADVL